MKRHFKIALAGNPNSGKTTIFNHLTGARQHVGNYPGVTVERKSGHCSIDEFDVELIDLPGTYSLNSASPEERIAAEELQSGKIDLILNVIDSSNPQRNLYLTLQLAELRIPMIMVFNMADDAKKRGFSFQYDILEGFFGAPIAKTIGAQGIGIGRLKQAIAEKLASNTPPPIPKFTYGAETDQAIMEIADAVMRKQIPLPISVPVRYLAIKLLEEDRAILAMPAFAPVLAAADAARERLATRAGVDAETLLADQRYGIISGACHEAIRITQVRRAQISENIDRVLANRYLGLPIFLAIMFLIFLFTFTCAEPVTGWLEAFFSWISDGIAESWSAENLPFLRAMVIDGVIGGVGGVLSFLPNILFLFLAIAFLEGTGYMSRAAYIMDGVMHKFGLHGKSFIPMLLGFGCSVPAVMATRTIESERDRLTTIMIIPLMSCGARLPIYALIIPAFFPEKFQALVMWLIYIIGILLALAAARLLKSTLFRGGDEVYVMELPPYRMPTFRSLMIHMWERASMYLRKAGTLILLASIIMFFINTLPVKKDFSEDYAGKIEQIEGSTTLDKDAKAEQILALETRQKAELLEYSASGRIGNALTTVMAPLGFDWKISASLIGAFAAKELFVSQLGILYAIGEADGDSIPLRAQLQKHYTPLQGFCVMLFCLISMPCLATVAVVRRETNSWPLTLMQMGGLTALAYVCTLVVYQIGSFCQIGTSLL